MTNDIQEIEKSPRSLDQALRPSDWADYVGQPGIKENLRILLTAAKGRNSIVEYLRSRSMAHRSALKFRGYD